MPVILTFSLVHTDLLLIIMSICSLCNILSKLSENLIEQNLK